MTRRPFRSSFWRRRAVPRPESAPASTPQDAPGLTPELARLRRALGNRAVQEALDGETRGGVYERQAERAARGALKATPEGPETLEDERRRPSDGGPRDTATALSIAGALDPGRPLGDEIRGRFEQELGRGLEDVRLHTGAEAAQVARACGARAFTAGRHVVFDDGELTAGTEDTSGLLAHELSHVVQQAEDPSAPAIQRTPRRPTPLNFNQLLADLDLFVQLPNDPRNPPAIRFALGNLAGFGVPLSSITFSRLTNASWVMGGLHVHAQSRWPQGGSPEIAVSDTLLRELHSYDQDPRANTGDGFSIIRTLAHELRHLQRQHQRSTGARSATVTERKFEAEITRRARATPAGLTPQQYAQLHTGQLLYAQTAYPVDEILARLAEVATARREWALLRRQPGGPTQADRDHMEIILQEIGFRIYYQINVLRGSARRGAAGLTIADFNASMREVESEVRRRYGRSSPEHRLWSMARRGLFGTAYHPMVITVPRVFP